jgi:hypothetical protein
MANGKWQMANGKWQMANGKWQMANGKWHAMLAEIKMQHGSPAEAKPFLEVARVRADQAEISA